MSYSEMSDEGSGYYCQTVNFYLHLEAPMINLSYNVHVEGPDFQLFQNWNRFNYSQCIRELNV